MADTTLVLGVDSRQVRTAAGDLDRLTGASRRVEGSVGSLATSFKGLGAALGVVSAGVVIKNIVDQADVYKTLNARLRLVTGSTNEFALAQAELFQIAQSTRTGLEATTSLFGSLSRSTSGLGKSQGEVLAVTETINQALAVSGTNAQSAAAALVQLGQGFSSGVLRGEELNSVLEQAPRLAQAIADGLGVPIGKLRELGQAGKLTAKEVFDALQKSGQSIDAEFRRLPLTVGAASTQASNALLKLIGVIDDTSGATKGLASIISDTAEAISELADEIKRVSEGQESVSLLAEIFVSVSETLQVLAANVSFVFKGIGREIGAVAAQIVALGRLDIQGFTAISDAVTEDAKRARAELDALEQRVLRRAPAFEAIDTRSEDARLRRGIKAAPTSGGKVGGSKRDPFGDEIKSLREQIALVGALTELEKTNAQITLGKFGKLSVAQQNQLRGLAAEYDARKAIFDIAQAQTDLSIGRIKRQLDQQTGAFAAAEAILEAQRAAGLTSEREYTDAKIELLNKQSDAQIKAIEAENAALQSKKATGLEQVRIQEQIADNEARIATIRLQTGTEVERFRIQQVGAAKAAQKAIEDTEAALQSYLDALIRSQSIELGGIGLGNKERDRLRQRADIEDRFEQRRQELLRSRRDAEFAGTFGAAQQAQYDAELAAIQQFQQKALTSFDSFYAKRAEKERDFNSGALESLRNYVDEVANISKDIEGLFTNAFKGAEDALTTFFTTGKLDAKSFATSLVADINRIIVRQNITGPLAQAIQEGFGSGSGIGGFIKQALGGLFGNPATQVPGFGGGTIDVGKLGGAVGKAAETTAVVTAITTTGTANTAALSATITASDVSSTAALTATITATSATETATLTAAGAAEAASIVAAIGTLLGASNVATDVAESTVIATAVTTSAAATTTALSTAIATTSSAETAALSAAITTTSTAETATLTATSAAETASLIAAIGASSSAIVAAIVAKAVSGGSFTGEASVFSAFETSGNQPSLERDLLRQIEAQTAGEVADFGAAIQSVTPEFDGLLAGVQRAAGGLSGLPQVLQSIFSGFGGSAGGVLSSLGSIFGGFFEHGGRPPVGRVSVVGEKGPELFIPDSAGAIMSNSDSRAALTPQAGSAVYVTVNQNFSGNPTKATLEQAAALTAREVQTATARGTAAMARMN